MTSQVSKLFGNLEEFLQFCRQILSPSNNNNFFGVDPLLAKAVISNIFNNNTEIYGLVVMQNGNSGEVIPLVPYEDKSTNDKCGDSTVPIISKKGICPMSGLTYNYSNISLNKILNSGLLKIKKQY